MNPISIEVVVPLYAQPDDQVPIEELTKRLEGMKRFNFWDVDNDCRKFAETMTLWREKELYKPFSGSWEAFIAEHVQKPLEWVNHVIQGVKLLDGSDRQILTIDQKDSPQDIAAAIAQTLDSETLEQVLAILQDKE